MAKTVNLPFSVVRRANAINRDVVDVDDGNVTYEFVFEHEGTLYSACYLQTVNDGRYWGEFLDKYSPETVECVEVRPVEKTIVVYEPVEG